MRALDEVNRGRFSLDPKILDVLLDQGDGNGLAELTDAEREVAELVAGGLRNVTIGQRLCKSERTVEKHVWFTPCCAGSRRRDRAVASPASSCSSTMGACWSVWRC